MVDITVLRIMGHILDITVDIPSISMVIGTVGDHIGVVVLIGEENIGVTALVHIMVITVADTDDKIIKNISKKSLTNRKLSSILLP